MLIHPYDSSLSDKEWRDWVSKSSRFGVLAVPTDAGKAPIMVPTHFTLLETEVLVHLQRTNSALSYLATGNEVSLSIVGDYAYIESQWRARDSNRPQDGVPTSYYAAVNFTLRPTVISEPAGIAEILNAHMDDLQPTGGHAPIAAGEEPYGALMNSIRGVRLEIVSVEAKFKYDDHKTLEFRQNVSEQLRNRNQGLDAAAAAQQERRMALVGDWLEYQTRIAQPTEKST